MAGEATVRDRERSTAIKRVCVAIPTFRRLALLERLLEGIAALAAPAACSIHVLVMDNDATRSARLLVERAAQDFPFHLSYAHVADPGLSSVRNFAIASACRGYDYLAMIDDDESPDPCWLVELIRVLNETEADAAVGPVPQLAPPGVPRWLREASFLELPVFPDGTLIGDGWSGNCLLRVAAIERFALSFDPAFNFAGGEDLLFFRELKARGGRLAYARNAVARELASAERFTPLFILKLNFRRGNTLTLCDRRLGGKRMLALRAAKAYARLSLGCAALGPRALLRGRTGALEAACDIARALGSFAGLLGYTYSPYQRRPQKPMP